MSPDGPKNKIRVFEAIADEDSITKQESWQRLRWSYVEKKKS